MKVAFSKDFKKQLASVRDKRLATAVSKVIRQVKNAESLTDIIGIKKLKGHSSAYRIRTGNYRIGIFINSSEVFFVHLDHRKDIYSKFP